MNIYRIDIDSDPTNGNRHFVIIRTDATIDDLMKEAEEKNAMKVTTLFTRPDGKGKFIIIGDETEVIMTSKIHSIRPLYRYRYVTND